MFTRDPEDHIKKNEALFAELRERAHELEEAEKSLFEELNVMPEQVAAYIQNPENFTTENWETLQEQSRLLNQQIERDLNSIKNPLKSKKAYQERAVNNHWIFVR